MCDFFKYYKGDWERKLQRLWKWENKNEVIILGYLYGSYPQMIAITNITDDRVLIIQVIIFKKHILKFLNIKFREK